MTFKGLMFMLIYGVLYKLGIFIFQCVSMHFDLFSIEDVKEITFIIILGMYANTMDSSYKKNSIITNVLLLLLTLLVISLI